MDHAAYDYPAQPGRKRAARTGARTGFAVWILAHREPCLPADALHAAKLRLAIAANAMAVQHLPALVRIFKDRGCDWIAHDIAAMRNLLLQLRAAPVVLWAMPATLPSSN